MLLSGVIDGHDPIAGGRFLSSPIKKCESITSDIGSARRARATPQGLYKAIVYMKP